MSSNLGVVTRPGSFLHMPNKRAAESFSREKVRQAPQKAGGEILRDAGTSTSLTSRTNGITTHMHTLAEQVSERTSVLYCRRCQIQLFPIISFADRSPSPPKAERLLYRKVKLSRLSCISRLKIPLSCSWRHEFDDTGSSRKWVGS